MPPPAEGFASRLLLGPALRTQPDGRLVTLVREGYELAFEEIVRRYRKPLGRYAAAIVGPRSEDVTQDAFSKALLAMRRDEVEIDLRPWLYRIVRNTALNDLRDRPAAAAELAEEISGGRTPAEAVEQREELTDLMTRLQALPEAQRAAIVMRELEGLSHDEIAAALGLSGGAARQAIYRARQALRDGVGALLPLPLVKAMLAGIGPGAAESAAGAAGVGGAAGAGVAIKATAATVLVAGAVGAGIAIKGPPHPGKADDATAADRTVASRPRSDHLGGPQARQQEPTPNRGATGGDGGRSEGREHGAASSPSTSSGPEDGGGPGVGSPPPGAPRGASGHGESGTGHGDAHPNVTQPADGGHDSRHGEHGGLNSGEDDGFDHVDDRPEHNGDSGSGGDSGEETSSGEHEPSQSEGDHEETSPAEGTDGESGGEASSDLGDSSSPTPDAVDVRRDSRRSDGLTP